MNENQSNFIEMVCKWSEMLRHVFALNKQGYTDAFIGELGISIGVGIFPKDSIYVLILTTKDGEICVVGCKTLEKVESVLEEGGGWRPESLWKNDEKLKFKRIIVLG